MTCWKIGWNGRGAIMFARLAIRRCVKDIQA